MKKSGQYFQSALFYYYAPAISLRINLAIVETGKL